MEDEIDLREIVRGLLRNWLVIVGLAVLGALAGLGYGFLRPRSYEATALVSVAQPPYSLRLEGVNQTAQVPVRTYQDLAASDEVMAAVLQQATAILPPGVHTVTDLRAILAATPSADPSFLRLKASDANPDHAARLANLWAEALAGQAAQLYGPGTTQSVNYQDQLEGSRQRLAQAEQALADFQSQNQVSILQAELASRQFSLTDYLNQRYRFQVLAGGAQDLLARLEAQDGSSPASTADETTVLLLVAQASGSGLQVTDFSAGQQSTASSSQIQQSSVPPFQIQLSVGPASGQTVAQLTGSVKTLIGTLTTRSTEAQAEADSQRPAILDLQGQLAQAQAKQDQLERERDLADQEYRTLSDKVNQVKIAAQDASMTVRVASKAAIPDIPVGPGRMLLTAAGAAVGVILGMFLALVAEWWRTPLRAAMISAGEPATVKGHP